MKTHYYCNRCKIYFLEEGRPPNMNRTHYECGSKAKVIEHFPDVEEVEEGE